MTSWLAGLLMFGSCSVDEAQSEHRRTARSIVARHDTDGDRRLAAPETPDALYYRFDRMDADRDGGLSVQEIAGFLAGTFAVKPLAELDRLLPADADRGTTQLAPRRQR